MKTKITALVTAAALTVTACDTLTNEEQGALIGAGAGAVAAQAFDANLGWTVVTAAAGAAAGALIARNQRTNQCAYADGRGGYVTRPC
ncbi:glycine zipper 2TM domain-containing protein [Roseovarius atlanticus]|uniref:glycine zipper 2TM domain-containing protein n=1 Tax=Roseovarius atlanticus TaxID=1641875 RepID=UPI00070B46E3|nr:glycine zipper 2TM domain-containing protein [Roseovarius atlanticus]